MNKIKTSAVDFDENLLPYTRKKQFKEIMKTNYKKIGLIGLLLALFAIPLMMCHVAIPAARDTIYASLNEIGKTDAEIIGILSFYTFISDCVAIPCYALLSLAFAGSARIIKNLVYNEGILFKEDFFKGIKLYFKPFLCTFLIYGLVRAGFKGYDLLVINFEDVAYSALIGFITATFYILIVPIMMIYLSLSIFYEDKVSSRIVNSIKIYISFFLTNLLFIPYLLGLYFLLPLIPQFTWRLLAELILFIVIIPIYLLMYHLYMVYIFDKIINFKQYKEIYRKGLSKETKKD